jgi:outer membrane biogenesis lipoprotein LolB
MQAPIRKLAALLLLTTTVWLVSCASDRPVTVVNDPDDNKEKSMIPWNKQEKWESQGNLGNITDRR